MAASKPEQDLKDLTFVVRDAEHVEGMVAAGPIIRGKFYGSNIVSSHTADNYIEEHGYEDQRASSAQPGE